MRILLILFYTFGSLTFHFNYLQGAASRPAQPAGSDLQAILNAGEDLYLEPGVVYEISEPLKFTRKGQKITTLNPKSLDNYATLRIVDEECGQLINGNHIDKITLERVKLDGNRYRLSTLSKDLGTPPLVFMGGAEASEQVVRQCVFIAARTWSTLKVHEGGSDILVEDNIFIGAGSDVRGNGREYLENPKINGYAWGDGISCAAKQTTIRNNLILDPTDVGIVLFGAPGSIAENNVIATVSRESLGGINLVDPLQFWVIDGDKSMIDYRKVLVSNNWIDARGSRIHMGIPVGAVPWVPSKKGFTFVGGTVANNLITGDCAAYGIILSGITKFNVTGNISQASYSGIAEGLSDKEPPDDPVDFVYNPEVVTASEIQPEFKAMQRHISHLLRCNHLPKNDRGYRDYPYGEYEVVGVVKTAFEEMLGRLPHEDELSHYTDWLNKTQTSADNLRLILMGSPEFLERHGAIKPHELQLFREQLWLTAIANVLGEMIASSKWMKAEELYKQAWNIITKN
ncbi:MAG: right-handed parallel beta-helix repeat-containing protein [Verrucomicrobiota bacterium]